jgi:Uri superfamily endonuclease
VTAMDLPEAKGTYVLIACVAQMKHLEIGRLGAYGIVPGHYACVGSALGAGGLRGRIGHHLESTAIPHWRIDYLLGVAEPVESWYRAVNQKLERYSAGLLQQAPQCRVPIPQTASKPSSAQQRARSC